MIFESYSDEELALLAKTDSSAAEALIKRTKGIILSLTRKINISGYLSREDLVQEGTIALLTAINKFDESKNASFKTFAYICILNRFKNLVKVSIAQDYSLIDINEVVDTTLGIEDEFLNRQNEKEFKMRIDSSLSMLESDILELYLKGYTYLEMAKILKVKQKSVDNALKRCKRKIKEHIEE